MSFRNAPYRATLSVMITTCPACGTVFRINDWQLAARDGSVRCGRCSTVFDARAALRPEPFESLPRDDGAAEEPAREPSISFPEIDHVTATPHFSMPPVEISAPPEAEPSTPVPPVEIFPQPAPEPNISEPEQSTPEPEPSTPELEPSIHEPEPSIREPEPPTAKIAPPAAPKPVFAPSPKKLVLRPAKRAPRRGLWAGLSALLVLALAAQVAFQYRSEIARIFPQIRPAMLDICARLDCDVPLPRHAGLISIESSDLQADPANPGIMVLTATLRNRATFDQARPSLELTLTDARDQTLARRVLGVRDYIGPAASPEAPFLANSEMSVKVYIKAASLKATGYRLYLFYP